MIELGLELGLALELSLGFCFERDGDGVGSVGDDDSDGDFLAKNVVICRCCLTNCDFPLLVRFDGAIGLSRRMCESRVRESRG